jgi:hypothetical protein
MDGSFGETSKDTTTNGCHQRQAAAEHECETAHSIRKTEDGVEKQQNMAHGVVKHLNKGKAIPVKCRGGPQGCETSRLPHFL